MSRYAFIDNNTVENVTVGNYHDSNRIANRKGMTAVNVDIYPVQKGDTYDGSNFWRGEIEIQPIKNDSQKLAEANIVIDDLLIDNLVLTEIVDNLICQSLVEGD